MGPPLNLTGPDIADTRTGCSKYLLIISSFPPIRDDIMDRGFRQPCINIIYASINRARRWRVRIAFLLDFLNGDQFFKAFLIDFIIEVIESERNYILITFISYILGSYILFLCPASTLLFLPFDTRKQDNEMVCTHGMVPLPSLHLFSPYGTAISRCGTESAIINTERAGYRGFSFLSPSRNNVVHAKRP